MNRTAYTVFCAMACIPWGCFSWAGLGVQLVGIVGQNWQLYREYGTLNPLRWQR